MAAGKILTVEPLAAFDLGEREPVLGNVFENTADEEDTAVRHVRRHAVAAVQDALLEFSDSFRSERHQAGDHEVEQDAEGPDVDEHAVVMLVFEQFRGRVRRRATESIESFVTASDCTKSKVPDLDPVDASVENVFCFEVSMDDVVLVLWKNT